MHNTQDFIILHKGDEIIPEFNLPWETTQLLYEITLIILLKLVEQNWSHWACWCKTQFSKKESVPFWLPFLLLRVVQQMSKKSSGYKTKIFSYLPKFSSAHRLHSNTRSNEEHMHLNYHWFKETYAKNEIECLVNVSSSPQSQPNLTTSSTNHTQSNTN